MAQSMRIKVPTYNASLFGDEAAKGIVPEFGPPEIPVLVREAEGVRIVLGSHEFWDCSKPDVQIERQPNGWVIFLHPIGGGDPAGYVYFYDDGRCVLLKERPYDEGLEIQVLEPGSPVPYFHEPEERS